MVKESNKKMIKSWVIGMIFVTVIGIIATAFHLAKQSGVEKQRMVEHVVIIEDKKNDAKIAARADSRTDDLLERMRTEND